jgi:small conductance mechanosensitive channel
VILPFATTPAASPSPSSHGVEIVVGDRTIWTPIALVVVVVATFVLRWLVRRFIDRVVGTFTDTTMAKRLARSQAAHGDPGSAALIQERTAARARTVGQLLKSVSSFVLLSLMVIVVLATIGIDITPILASAGIIGVAVGFGAQSLIKDFLTGIFMIFEDQYGVGDVIDTGQATGTVEGVGLRVTRLRDDNGVLWYVPNGSIQRVGNKSQGWAIATVEIPVAYSEDLDRVQGIVADVAQTLAVDPQWRTDILDEPPTTNIESMQPGSVTLRVALKTAPLRQNAVARELRVRAKEALDEAGVRYGESPA